MSQEAAGRIFDRPPAASEDFEAEPQTQIVILRFATEEQRIKASNRILDTGMLRVRIMID
jgi:hypothetical protein